MAEQIILNIVRPQIGIEYRAESPEAVLADRLAACHLGLHALARHVQELHELQGTACPLVVQELVASDEWVRGF